MAIKKTFDLDNGFSGDYWKITNLVHYYLNNEVHCTVSLYKDGQTRVDKPKLGIIYNRQYVFTGDDYADFNGDVNDRDVAYAKLMTHQNFIEAESI